jgi:predicted RNase H-like HicB family nuclease
MLVAEALDFPGAVTQGFDLPDARLMIASALEDLAQLLLEEGRPLPLPSKERNGRTPTSSPSPTEMFTPSYIRA